MDGVRVNVGVSVSVGVRVNVGVSVSVGVNVNVGVGVFVHESAVEVSAADVAVACASGDNKLQDVRHNTKDKRIRYFFI
jgi:hypothetical protein